ncbi:hypothetical protein [Aestuariimicrobium kwangyangense]|uniref:hypothetical protein n=1 Tax=Aestuariimicrobium kwangyangense TaxID=396389 RepID=UPI0003B35B5E|nr:hypothetical protein [Aestuariimicrobium kwangyangense]
MTHTPRDNDPAYTQWAPEEPFPTADSDFVQTEASRGDGGAWPTTATGAPAGSSQDRTTDDRSTTQVGKEEATRVKDAAVDAGSQVVDTARSEAAHVAAEARDHAKNLLDSLTQQLSEQAGTQQQSLASGLRSLTREMHGMATGSTESGPLTSLARQAAHEGSRAAEWLETREPADVLAEVTSFARRKPVTFLALCGLAGVVAGRLTRGAVAANTSLDSGDGARAVEARRSEYPAVRESAPFAPEPVGGAGFLTTDQPVGPGGGLR